MVKLRLTIDDATARQIAAKASRESGFPVSATTVREVLAGRRVFRGAAATRFVLEREGFHVPLLREDER